MAPEISASILSTNDLTSALNIALNNPVSIAKHDEMSQMIDLQTKSLLDSPMDRSQLQRLDFPDFPKAICDLTPYVDQLTLPEITGAINQFTLTSGYTESLNSSIHELAHYVKAKALNFPYPKILVYFFYDKTGMIHAQWLMDHGQIPPEMSDDDLRIATYQMCLAPSDPSPSDRKTALAIRTYFWKNDKAIHQ
jgi:hypothetical protein